MLNKIRGTLIDNLWVVSKKDVTARVKFNSHMYSFTKIYHSKRSKTTCKNVPPHHSGFKQYYKSANHSSQIWRLALESFSYDPASVGKVWVFLSLDLEKLKVVLQKKSEYPPKLIDNLVNKYLSKNIMNKPSETEVSKTKENIRYFKLFFIGRFSKFNEIKLQKLAEQFCKEGTNIKIIFSIFKLASVFPTKVLCNL